MYMYMWIVICIIFPNRAWVSFSELIALKKKNTMY